MKSGFSPLILDCGANIGASAKYFAENFPEALVVAVEPEIENFKLLTRNCVENNILPVHAGVAANDTKGDVFDPGLGNWGFRVSENNVGGIELKSIPTLLTRNECINRKPFLIKIDIEGFEENLFSANTGWIQEFPIMIIELHDWMLTNQANSRNFLKTISTYHRDFVYIGENVFSIAIADAIGVRHSDKSQ